jgi:ADP-L-glycero-D-manno-heptose 6-epimerase
MIILTGGAGFIGSVFLKKLNQENVRDIIIVDNIATSDKWKNLLNKNFVKYISKKQFFENLENKQYYNQIDAIFHFGACSSTTELDFDYLIENNLNFSIKLCEIALEYNIPFHYASSAATYGLGENGFSDKFIDNLSPLNRYGYSKHLFDRWIIDNNYLDKVTGYKFFNVFGPNEYHKGNMASMIYKSYNQILENGVVRLFKSNVPQFSDGGQIRDFIYVKDVVNVMYDFYMSNIKGIYNLGTGVGKTWLDLVNAVFNAMDKSPNIEFINMPDEISKQYQNYTVADMSKFIKLSNYNFLTLEDAINDYVRNHLVKDWQYI